MPEHGGQNVGHAKGDSSWDRVPLPAHCFDLSQGLTFRATSPGAGERCTLAFSKKKIWGLPITCRFHGPGDCCRCRPGRSVALPSPSTLSSVPSHSLLSVLSANPSARSKSRSCAWAPTMQNAT